MDILVHHQREITTNREKGQDSSRKNKRKTERRKSARDRRRSVNEGIVVSLSTSEDNRRLCLERRQCFFPPHILESAKRRSGNSFVDIVA